MADEPYPPHVLHELKNQLALISGYCDLLLEDTPHDAPGRGDLLEIRKAVAAALQLVEQRKKA